MESKRMCVCERMCVHFASVGVSVRARACVLQRKRRCSRVSACEITVFRCCKIAWERMQSCIFLWTHSFESYKRAGAYDACLHYSVSRMCAKCMCMCVCVYVWTCAYVYACMCVNVLMWMCVFVYVYGCLILCIHCLCLYVCVSVHMAVICVLMCDYVCEWACVCKWVHKCVCQWAYVYVCVSMRMCLCICVCVCGCACSVYRKSINWIGENIADCLFE